MFSITLVPDFSSSPAGYLLITGVADSMYIAAKMPFGKCRLPSRISFAFSAARRKAFAQSGKGLRSHYQKCQEGLNGCPETCAKSFRRGRRKVTTGSAEKPLRSDRQLAGWLGVVEFLANSA